MTREAKVTTAGTARMKAEPSTFNDFMKDMTRLSLARCLATSEHPCKNRPQTAATHSKRSEQRDAWHAGACVAGGRAGERTELQSGNELPTAILVVMVHRVVD